MPSARMCRAADSHASPMVGACRICGVSLASAVTTAPGSPGSPVAQRDLVRLGDVVGLDGPQPLAEALAGLPAEVGGVGEGVLRQGAGGVGAVLLDEVRLEGRGDFVGCLQGVVDGPVPCGVVNHSASILAPRL